MEENDFTKTVREMRKWQKEYFRTRQPRAKDIAIKYEKKVDAMLEAALNPPLF